MSVPSRTVRAVLFGVAGFFGLSLSVFLAAHSPGYRVEPGYPALIYVPGYSDGPRVTAESAVLIDEESGAILFAKGEHVRRAPASTTKILTALLAVTYGRLNDTVIVSRRAALVGGSTIGLRAGDRIRLGELLKGVLMCSGNDGSVAVAEHLAGSEMEFARRMTVKAHEMGALNSQFKNAHGLTAVGHYSTAYDLALLARQAMQLPTFARLVTTRQAQMAWEERGKMAWLNNTNKLLWTLEGADGVKTGTTSRAGKCLVASASRGRRRLIAVVLHSYDRWGDAARLLEYGFESFRLCWGAREGQAVASVQVKGGRIGHITLVPRAPLCVPVRAGRESDIRRVIEVPRVMRAPLRPGLPAGRMALYDGDQELCATDLIVPTEIRRRFLWWVW